MVLRKSALFGFLLLFGFLSLSDSHPINKNLPVYIRFNASHEYRNTVSSNEFNKPISLSRVQEYSKSNNVGSSLKCFACKEALNIALWKFRTPDRKYTGLFKFVISVCERLNIEPSPICSGIVNAMKNETQYLLKHLNVTGEMVCGLIFPSTCKTLDLSWNRDKWVVPIASPRPQNTMSLTKNFKSKAKPLRVLQISDLHIDFQYKPGSPNNCKEPLCCHKDSTSRDNAKAGYWGDYGSCDVPYWTVENFFQHVSKEKFDYIIWTGDLPAHNDWSQTKESQLFLLKNLTKTILKYFPNTPVYPALGNHESFPVNSFPPAYVTNTNSINWLYNALVDAWSPWLKKDALQTVRKSGFYTQLVKPGLRLISLNMNYCNTENYWMLINPVDPNGELEWLEGALHKAEQVNEKVHIIGHIPPSIGGDCLDVWRSNYYNIIMRYRHIVRGQFFGHTHKDELEILYTNSSLSEPVSVAYIAPSITTFSDLNPGYRVYEMDGEQWNILDHQTYILNLAKANQLITGPQWELEYSAKNAYNLTTLSVESWHELYQNWMHTRKSSISFHKYYSYYYKGHPPKEVCDAACRKQLLCSISAGNFTVTSC
ncbi:sphingomyelin phosphodiesterase-like [Clavelina lepadiformis]|uniref:sphingomyelin phosphodiesterase-like n=1 Tax=Clavelina lepadiformis TaxID=159417 RepID=UPI0040419D1B